MVIGLRATPILQGCVRAIVSEVPLTYGIVARCRNRASVDVGLNVRFGVTVRVPSDKVHVVVVFTKTFSVVNLVL